MSAENGYNQTAPNEKTFTFLSESSLEELTAEFTKFCQTYDPNPGPDALNEAIARFNTNPLLAERGQGVQATLMTPQNDLFPVTFIREGWTYGPKYQRARLALDYTVTLTPSGVKVTPKICARLDLEPRLAAVDFRYVPESRILTAAVYDEHQDRVVQPMSYAFTLNETRTREGLEPFYALRNEWGVFGLSVKLGGQEIHAQNAVQVGNLVRPQTREIAGANGSGPALEPGNSMLHPGLRLKSMHRPKFKDVAPEPHEIAQKKTYPKDYVAEEFW